MDEEKKKESRSKITALLLVCLAGILSVALAACGKAGSGTEDGKGTNLTDGEPSGAYIEEEIAFPAAIQKREKGIYSILLSPDGDVVLYAGSQDEKAKQQINPPAQIKGKMTVIPEYRPKYQLRKHAAYVLVCAADYGSKDKDIPVRLVLIPVQKQRQQYNRKPPDHTERSVDNTAAAHQLSHRDIAPDCLRNISQKRTDKKEPHQLMKAASLGENAGLLFLLLCR